MHLQVEFSYQSFVYHKYYKDAVRRGNNYYSEDIQVDISWINKSVFAFFSLEMICAISTFFPNMCFAAEFTLSVYKVITILCVFHQFLNFIKHIDVMASVYSEPEIEDIEPEIEESYYKSLTIEQYAQIGKCLDKWVGDKGYTKCGVTIKDVATAVATNRTYLSVYINTTYGCSFKVWITSMRIKRAKELLMGEYTTVYISQKVGFSSPKSFMHAFKRSEGETPTQWRTTNKTT